MKLVYKTFDGKIFDSAAAATEHEEALLTEAVESQFSELLDRARSTLTDTPEGWDGCVDSQFEVFKSLLKRIIINEMGK